MKRILALLMAISMCFALTACGNSQTNENEDRKDNSNVEQENIATNDAVEEETPEEEVTEPEEEAVTALTIGEAATLGDWEFTVDSVEITDSVVASAYSAFNADEGSKYVVATITVKNVGTTADSFVSSYSLANTDIITKIMYQDTYEYSASNLLGHSSELHNTSFNPLEVKTGVIAFSLPDEAANSNALTLVFTLGKDSVTYSLAQ